MNNKLHDITQKVKGAVLGYPMVLAMSLLMASTIVFLIESDWKSRENFTPMRIIFTAALGISLMFAIKMLSQRIGRSLLLHLLGLALLTAYYFVLPASEKDFTDVYVFVLFPSFVLSHLLVACIAFIGKAPEIKFWQFNKNLFVNFFLTVIFTGVLTGGVMLAILAVDQLFGVDFDNDSYGETFVMLSVFGSTIIFLLFNEDGLEYLEKEGSYPVVLKFFTQFILIPLLLIYVVILYFYSAKILLRWQLPEGWVSYLVLAYAVVGILALLLVHPLKDTAAKSWVKIFSSLFYFSLLPLIVLLFTAIFTRVLEYGFTEARYYVLLLAVWLLSVVLYFIFSKRGTIKFIPVSLFVLGMFSLLFPYLNTFSVAKRSQKHELEKILSEQHLLENGKINFNKTVSSDVAENITDKFEFLSQRFEYDYLDQFLNPKDKKAIKNEQTWYISALFKNVTETAETALTSSLELYNNALYCDISDYDYVVKEKDFGNDEMKLHQDHFTLKSIAYSQTPVFKLTLNSAQAVDFMPQIKGLFEKYQGRIGNVQTDSLFVESDLGNYHVKVVFDNISQTTYKKEVNYYFSEALFFLRENK
jgi:hypothetical protein